MSVIMSLFTRVYDFLATYLTAATPIDTAKKEMEDTGKNQQISCSQLTNHLFLRLSPIAIASTAPSFGSATMTSRAALDDEDISTDSDSVASDELLEAIWLDPWNTDYGSHHLSTGHYVEMDVDDEWQEVPVNHAAVSMQPR